MPKAYLYTLARKTIAIPLSKKMFMVMNSKFPDACQINDTGRWTPMKKEDLTYLQKDGEDLYHTSLPTYAGEIDVQLTNGGTYSFTTLLKNGFITEEMAQICSATILETQADLRKIDLDPDLDRLEVMKTLIANGRDPSSANLLGASTATASDKADTIEVDSTAV